MFGGWISSEHRKHEKEILRQALDDANRGAEKVPRPATPMSGKEIAALVLVVGMILAGAVILVSAFVSRS